MAPRRGAEVLARLTNRLTDRATRSLKAPGYHPDGDGLYLQVTASGSRSWIYRYRFGGRRRDMGLGSLSDVSLVEARAARNQARQAITAGSDPLKDRRPTAVRPARLSCPAGEPAPTLLQCWTEYVDAREPGWRGRKTRAGWMRSIEQHAAAIKNKPVADIDTDDVLRVLKPLWTEKAESAGKLRERLEQVLDYARVRKHRSGDNPATWKGHLVHLLPPRPKLQRGHMRAVPYQELPALMQRLAGREGVSARALEFTILTVARETMTLEASWSEIEGNVWELHASRMKERAFRQPLSAGAMEVLRKVKPTGPTPNGLIFPSQKGGVLSDMAMDMLLRELAPPYTPHGMRSAFRDWAGDETYFARETIEECLAHTVGDETERAYRRGDALKKRRAVLEAWSAYCLG